MNSHGLTMENLLKTFPVALRADKSVVALADAIAQVLAQRPAEIDWLRIYPDISRLDGSILDILAYDFKVDWWDAEYSLEEKRRTLRDNWNVHRTLGTKYAVETALGNIFPGAKTEEWFEYGGTPCCFRMAMPIPDEGVTAEKQRRVLSRVWYYKNLRSHLEGYQLNWESTGHMRMGAYTAASHTIEIWPELVARLEIAGQAGLVSVAAAHQMMDVYPELPVRVETTGKIVTDGITAAMQVVEIYPETERVGEL